MDDIATLVVMVDALIWGYVLGSLIYLALTSDVMRETGNRFRRWRHRNRPPFLPCRVKFCGRGFAGGACAGGAFRGGGTRRSGQARRRAGAERSFAPLSNLVKR